MLSFRIKIQLQDSYKKIINWCEISVHDAENLMVREYVRESTVSMGKNKEMDPIFYSMTVSTLK